MEKRGERERFSDLRSKEKQQMGQVNHEDEEEIEEEGTVDGLVSKG